MQSTANILMIRPVAFGFNPQTEGNTFQHQPEAGKVQERALAEFNQFVTKLRLNHINVIVIEDTLKPHTPDSIFPNNWVSFHNDGSVYVYPMQAENRRNERRDDILDVLSTQFDITEINDLTFTEDRGEYLEGTGSMVLDRDYKIAYACLSIRTNPKALEVFCNESGYEPITFHGFDEHENPIYHTNVMMCVAEKFVVICLESISDPLEKEKLVNSFKKTEKEIIEISFEQMNSFAGNMLEVKNTLNQTFLVMSESAKNSLVANQIATINKYAEILYSPIPTIEKIGGGSARCMMAEIHLDKRN
ncbi:citrulline utilization hydrolase CtlX [Pedobacter arcticus]|uniref:citrulline utilization hydrolase CtlX n=1 Tax=Pedobacter arcticus TaxID=752140 RepID=UPI000302D597|nr:arginine deiminase-related protein [Pedobacter arcticus]